MGYLSVEEMQANLSYEEYLNWRAFFSEEGYPQDNQEWWSAMQVSTIMSTSGRWKKQFKVSDLLIPKWQSHPEEKSLQEQTDADKAFGEKLMRLKSAT